MKKIQPCSLDSLPSITPTKGSRTRAQSPVVDCPGITGDNPPCTEPVYAQYMVVPCPEYQHFPELEHAEFFQNTLNNVFAIFQLSKL
jgi:hypothetical protein